MDVGSLRRIVADAVSDRNEILAVFVFGSASEGRMHARSDIDLGLLLAESASPERCFEISLEVGARIETKVGRRVQMIVLNRAHPSLAFRALRGRRLLDRDPVARSLFTIRTISRYHDYRRFLRRHVPAMEARALEGRFGTTR
jgi:hypothetical protein